MALAVPRIAVAHRACLQRHQLPAGRARGQRRAFELVASGREDKKTKKRESYARQSATRMRADMRRRTTWAWSWS